MTRTVRPSYRLGALLLLGLILTLASATVESGDEQPSVTPLMADELRDAQRLPELPAPKSGRLHAPSVLLRMPLLATDWWTTTAYVDLDDTTGILDYACQTLTYDGHDANDVAISDFVAQDEGRFIVAAAPGVVVSTHDGEFDRQIDVVPDAIGNHVILEHADGTQTLYWHLRKWSVLVAPGQQVLEGQPLGLVGSSGMSNGPHLHFAVRFGEEFLEPHAGACNPGESLWRDQLPHSLDNPMTVARTVISTEDPWPGDAYKFRPPDVLHIKQEPGGTTTYFWFRLRHGHPGDEARMIYLDPDGEVYTDRSVTLTFPAGYIPGRWTTVLPGTGSLGTWTVQFRIDGALVATRTFVYDAVEYQNPVALGRTVPVHYGVAAGDLHGSDADSGIKEFRIVSPPAHGRVELSGPRQSWFTYTPNSGFAGPDPFTFEVEDAQGQVSAATIMTMTVSPVVANVLRLEGEDDHVAIPDDGTLNPTQAMTLEAWVRRTTGSAGWNVLFDRRNSTNETGFSLGIQPSGTLRFGIGDGTVATFAYGTTPVPLDRWTHVAAVWDGAMMRLYVDGVEEPDPEPYGGTISYPGSYETWLGRSRTPGNSFRGEIDEMRVWNVARSATELQQGATCSFLDAPPPASLVGWWRFEGDALDSSPYGNHGSLVTPAYFRVAEGAFEGCAALDTDLDGIADDLDNCARAANSDQVDTDGDGLGDICDGCPETFGPRQYDVDRDGIPDACDACPFRGDTGQVDTDDDGSGDTCDPDPGDSGTGLPQTVTSLMLDHDALSGMTTLSWTADSLAVSYQVFRASLEELRARHYGACISSEDPDDTDTSFVDANSPAPGELFGYLAVGMTASGERGFSGLDSTGRMRDLRAKDCM